MADPSDVAPDGGNLDLDDASTEPHVDQDAIAQRAYELSQTNDSGTDEQNWLRAERELRSRAAP